MKKHLEEEGGGEAGWRERKLSVSKVRLGVVR